LLRDAQNPEYAVALSKPRPILKVVRGAVVKSPRAPVVEGRGFFYARCVLLSAIRSIQTLYKQINL
jgi:hypothetical protein